MRLSPRHSMFALLKIPVVCIMCLFLICGSGAIGFIDTTLSIYLEKQYHLSPVVRGAVFIVGPGVYALTTLVWGRIVDKKPRFNKQFICFGYTLCGVGFYLMGPAPFLPIPCADRLFRHMLWLFLVSFAMMGFGISTLVVAFQVITRATIAEGYPEGLDTYGLISGVFNTFFSFGCTCTLFACCNATSAFVGPLGGGYLQDTFGFEMSAVVIGSCSLGAVLLLLLHMFITMSRAPEKQALLGDGHVVRRYSEDEPLEGDR